MVNAAGRSRLIVVVLPAGFALVALIVAAWVIRPFRTVLIGSDTASSVLYFDRLVAGGSLERFLGTTPKPLLTVLDGSLHAVTGDWRPIAWLALIVYGVAIGTAVALTQRTSGPIAATFTGTALIASAGLLQDAALAYAVSWALLALCSAGLAMTLTPPRYATAGVALAVGSLARQEVLIVAGIAAIVVVARSALGRLGSISRPPREELRLVIGLAAVPMSMIHDLWLTGDPIYSLRVPVIGAEGREVDGIPAAIDALLRHGLGNGPLLVLAGIGLVVLYRQGPRSLLGGLLTVAIGVSVLVVIVGGRGLVVLDRYTLPVELALLVAAGCGAAFIIRRTIGRVAPQPVLVFAAVVLGLVVTTHIGPLDRPTLRFIHTERRAARDYAVLLPALRAAVEREPILHVPPSFLDATARDLADPALFVTPRLLSIVLVDLDLRLDRVARLTQLDPGTDPPAAGTLVLRVDAIDDPDDAPWVTVAGGADQFGVAVTPIDSVKDRAWLVRVDR